VLIQTAGGQAGATPRQRVIAALISPSCPNRLVVDRGRDDWWRRSLTRMGNCCTTWRPDSSRRTSRTPRRALMVDWDVRPILHRSVDEPDRTRPACSRTARFDGDACAPSVGQCLARIVAREGPLLQMIQLLLEQGDQLLQLRHPETSGVGR
jgi:hypothetical protein